MPHWSGENWGPYGGATNKAGDFWVTGWGFNAPGVRIDAATLQVDYHANPGGRWFYGMALDAKGNPWVGGCDGGVYTFDTQANQWQTVANLGGCLRGLQVDTEGRAFIAYNGGACLVVVDTETKQVINPGVQIPGCSTPVGVSIDVDGYVWVVDQGSGQAFKIDPDTYQVALTVGGLDSPYTYSDMTGAGLNLVINPPG